MKPILLLNLCALLLTTTATGQFSDGFKPDLRQTHRDEFDLNLLIQACSEGGDYSRYAPLYNERFAQRDGLWKMMPELYRTTAFFGEKRTDHLLDSLNNNGWSEADVAHARLWLSLIRNEVEKAEKQLEILRKDTPERFELLRAEIELIFRQRTHWSHYPDNKNYVLQVIRRVSNELKQAAYTEHQRVYLRLAHYDLLQLINEEQFSKSKALLDSVWQVRPETLHPLATWLQLYKASPEIQTHAFALLQNQLLQQPGESWQTMAILQSEYCDFKQPDLLLRHINRLPDERQRQIAKAIIYAQTYEHIDAITPNLGGLSFLVPKVKTPPVNAAFRARFHLPLPLETWNRLSREITGKTTSVSKEDLDRLLPLLPGNMSQPEAMQLIFGSLFRLNAEVELSATLANVLLKNYAVQRPSPPEVRSDWPKLYAFMKTQPNYLIKAYAVGFYYDMIPSLDEEPALLFDDQASLTEALQAMDELAGNYPASRAILHNKMTLITINCQTGPLATDKPDKQLLRSYGQALIASACIGNNKSFEDNVHTVPPVFDAEAGSLYTYVFAAFSDQELQTFRIRIAEALKKYPENNTLLTLESELEPKEKE